MAPYNSSMVLPTAVLVVNGLCIGISFVAIVLRAWSRLVVRRVKMRLCDYLIIFSWLLAIGSTVSTTLCVTRGGLGQPLETPVTMDELVFSTKQVLVLGSISTLAFACVKISILDLYLSVFEVYTRFRIWAYSLMAISAGYGISIFIVTWAGCHPFEANWNKITITDYTCVNMSALYTTQAALGATLDVLILVSPIPFVWKLRVKTSKKIGITALFTVGLGICAISLIRLWFNSRPDYQNAHFTEFLAYTAILGNLEIALAILCACLPTYPVLFSPMSAKIRSAFSSMHWSSYRRRYGGKSTGGFGGSSDASSKPERLGSKDEERAVGGGFYEGGETARLQMHRGVDKLYPLSVTTNTIVTSSAMRSSFEQQTAGGHLTSPNYKAEVVYGEAVEMGNVTGSRPF